MRVKTPSPMADDIICGRPLRMMTEKFKDPQIISKKYEKKIHAHVVLYVMEYKIEWVGVDPPWGGVKFKSFTLHHPLIKPSRICLLANLMGNEYCIIIINNNNIYNILRSEMSQKNSALIFHNKKFKKVFFPLEIFTFFKNLQI